jgi:hypothetical protein
MIFISEPTKPKKPKLQGNSKPTYKHVELGNQQKRAIKEATFKKQTVEPDNHEPSNVHKKTEFNNSVNELFKSSMSVKQQINVDINNTAIDKDDKIGEQKYGPSKVGKKYNLKIDDNTSKGKVDTESKIPDVETESLTNDKVHSVDDEINSDDIPTDCNQDAVSIVKDVDFWDDNEDTLDYRILDADKEVPTDECNDCDMKSTTLTYFRNHLKEKHNKDMPMYECKYCSKKLSFKRELKSHLLKDHKNSVEISECTLCDHITIYKGNLKFHALAVHKDDILQCDLCDFWTHQKQELESHSKSFHEVGVLIGINFVKGSNTNRLLC